MQPNHRSPPTPPIQLRRTPHLLQSEPYIPFSTRIGLFLTATRRLEIELEEDYMDKIAQQQKHEKRPFDQVNRGNPSWINISQQNKRPFQNQATTPICGYCKKIGHVERDCRLKHDLCLICGAANHKMGKCPSRIDGVPPLTHPAPLIRAPPIQARPPFPPQGQAHQQVQKGHGAGRGVRQSERVLGRNYQQEPTVVEPTDDKDPVPNYWSGAVDIDPQDQDYFDSLAEYMP